MNDEEKKKKEQEDFNKLFDEIFKNNTETDNNTKTKDQNDLLDDDFLKSIFNDDNKEKAKLEEEPNDNYDWLKELMDEIDKEEQNKKIQEQKIETKPVTPPKPVKPSFLSKIKDKPRAPKPPEHIRLWGSGKKIVKMPSRAQDNKSPPFISQKLKYFIFILMILMITTNSILLISYYFFPDIKNDLCKSTDIILKEGYTGDKILINKSYVTEKGKNVIDKGYIDPHITSLIYNIVKSDDKVIDVGAGFGYNTFYLARIVGNGGKVYAFEARKDVAELLECSLRINQLKNVEVFNKVLFVDNIKVSINITDNQKRSSFGVYKIISQHENIYDNIKDENTVDATTLDTSLNNIKNISLININANGHELSIILGAKNIIANSPNIKIITTWSQYDMSQYVNIGTVVQQLLNNGFKFWLIKESSGQLIPMTKEDIMQVEKGSFLITRSMN